MKFIVKHKEELGRELMEKVTAFLEKNGAEWTGETEDDADFAVVIGGDGTLLKHHSQLKCPILGLNPGHSVGHYMRACSDDYQEKILRLIKGKEGHDYHVYGLLRLEAAVNGRKMDATALNDVLVSPIYVRKALKSTLRIDSRESLETNSGIIVYTPTGSTAFAHSAGAKKIRYDRNVFGVTAFAPYAGELKKGEIVLGKGHVEIECLSDEGEVSIDGSGLNVRKLHPGDTVSVGKCRHPVKLVGFRKRFAG
jgi:NAD+ kinase